MKIRRTLILQGWGQQAKYIINQRIQKRKIKKRWNKTVFGLPLYIVELRYIDNKYWWQVIGMDARETALNFDKRKNRANRKYKFLYKHINQVGRGKRNKDSSLVSFTEKDLL